MKQDAIALLDWDNTLRGGVSYGTLSRSAVALYGKGIKGSASS